MTRTWPNMITHRRRAGPGAEQVERRLPNPEHNVTLPFTRMFLGPDGLHARRDAERRRRPSFARSSTSPMSLGTRCHQLAMYVVFESPLQMLADRPSNYLREPESHGVPGRRCRRCGTRRACSTPASATTSLVARRSGRDWYVGAMTDWTPRELTLDLAFLPEGAFRMTAYEDGVNAERWASDYRKTRPGRHPGEPAHAATRRGRRLRRPDHSRAMTAFDFRSVYNRVVPIVEKKYGVEVVISDVVDPNTGDFDGQQILIDYDQDLEVALFVLVHLFGHTVQWNVSEAYRNLGLNVAVGKTPRRWRRSPSTSRAPPAWGSRCSTRPASPTWTAGRPTGGARTSSTCSTSTRPGEKLDVRGLLKRGGRGAHAAADPGLHAPEVRVALELLTALGRSTDSVRARRRGRDGTPRTSSAPARAGRRSGRSPRRPSGSARRPARASTTFPTPTACRLKSGRGTPSATSGLVRTSTSISCRSAASFSLRAT